MSEEAPKDPLSEAAERIRAMTVASVLGGFCPLCKHPIAGHQDLGPYTRCSAIINVEWTAKDFRCTCRGEGRL